MENLEIATDSNKQAVAGESVAEVLRFLPVSCVWGNSDTIEDLAAWFTLVRLTEK